MKESIRCCISCILPCGALDVIRIVHASGRVEEIGRRAVSASDVMRAYPHHVLRTPPSVSYDDHGCYTTSAAAVLPPNAELRRGKIYFLMPVGPAAEKPGGPAAEAAASPGRRRRKKRAEEGNGGDPSAEDRTRLLMSDRYLSEILSESKASTGRERRRGRVGVWRPHLESIEEIASDVI